MDDERFDVVVVGAGLAGLAAATVAARRGARVLCLDGRADPGGRARTERVEGYSFNQGPHALYRGGAGWGVLAELGIRPVGHTPSYRRARLWRDGELLTPRQALSHGAWRDLGRALGPSARRRAAGRSTADWLDDLSTEAGRDAVSALLRITSYLADVEHVDAEASVAQLRRAQRGVWYLHGGWQQLVDGLRAASEAAGVSIRTRCKVTAVESDAKGTAVTHGDGGVVRSPATIVAAGGPHHADVLLGASSAIVSRWAADARPVVAACLDLAVSSLPEGRVGPVLGLDQPWYLIPHTPSARLAPAGGELVHAMRYSVDREPDADHHAALEHLVDAVHPTWREHLVNARFGRRLVVAHDRPQPGVATTDRPSHLVADTPGVFVAGDWITSDGMLADAALASGRAAGLAAAATAAGHGDARPITIGRG